MTGGAVAGEPVRLAAGRARAEILPGRGGALAGLSVGERPVLRPPGGRLGDGPFETACFVLAPFSNRISRPFAWNDGHVALSRNVPTEAFPIHGDAFQKPWTTVDRQSDRLVMTLANGAFGPLRYAARLTYALSPVGLRSELSLVSRCDRPMPFGLGFHPSFPRDGDTRLEFAARAIWEEGARHLPSSDAPSPIPQKWDFSRARRLPGTWVNNAFDGWAGAARILQGRAAVSVDMTVSEGLGTLIVFSPDEAADFFCAEPVSHPVDAHNLAGLPGLTILKAGETVTAAMTLRWSD